MALQVAVPCHPRTKRFSTRVLRDRHSVGSMAGKPLDELDLKILRALAETGVALRPKEIAERIGEDGRRVAAKMRKLVRLGYVKRHEDGRYELTLEGRKALEQV